MLEKINPLRSAGAFFLIALSTAFLFSIGVRLTGWFTRAPVVPPQDLTVLGLSIMVAVICLVVGAGLRRMSASELQSALLGASAVLLATPLATDVIKGEFTVSTAIVSGLGLLLLALGILVAFGRRDRQVED
ncbi:MAG TPA: hypothetical protein VG407_05135 [Caulobacteraceae bacterium]|jgi:hypothetical protein|nr:hypothetical protein [Caulobacteraceae bacterium]